MTYFKIRSWKEFQFLLGLFNIKERLTFNQICDKVGIYKNSRTAYRLKKYLLEFGILQKTGYTEINGVPYRLYRIKHRNLMWFFREDVEETRFLHEKFSDVFLEGIIRPKRKREA